MNSKFFRSQAHSAALTAFVLFTSISAFGQVRGGAIGGSGNVGSVGGGGGGGGGGTTTGSRQYQNSTLVGDASISSDVDTRQIVIVTDPLTNESIRAVIAKLDKPRPQVLINVVFMQVTHDNSFDLGAEAKYQGPISIKTNPDGIAQTKFGVADALANRSITGAFYSVTGRDIQATIHASAGVSKTEILSRPSILTRSNQQATILVGQNVPLLNTTTQNLNSANNSVTSTITYQDVGIILRVTPFITQDGLVEMIVSPEISSISPTTVSIPGAGNATVIDRRSADTVVVTPSDQTIVIGGLMSSQKSNVDNKVPLLGDIPLIGNLFKRKTKEDVKTELLIFMTPHVVKNPSDLATLSEGERSRLDMAPTTFDKADISKFLPGVAPGNNAGLKP
jgi:general secretion pathway protein D